MKIESLHLKYFKRFRDSKIDFIDKNTGLAQDLIVLIGVNGSGKTTILQAIAATLGTATGRLTKPSDLEWSGFNYELLSNNWGQFDSEVELNIQFSLAEIEATQRLFQKLPNLTTPPGENSSVSLSWKGDRVVAKTPAELFQFKGRQYAKQLLKTEGFQVFEQVGTILWYPEYRSSTSLTPEHEYKLEITEDLLRDRLSKWRQFHRDIEDAINRQLRPGQKDLYAEIEKAYRSVFPNRIFKGPVPRENIDDIFSEPWFYLYDVESKNQYEISEMSGGERAILPILIDFASWNIHNSVILIDEIELHLHPPMQQALLRALPKLGKNNQFIITTHSDYIETLVPPENIRRINLDT